MAVGIDDISVDQIDELWPYGINSLPVVSAAATRYWLGTTDDDASDPLNWASSTGGGAGSTVPDSTDSVVMDGNGNNACDCDGLQVVNLTLGSGYASALSGDLSVSGNIVDAVDAAIDLTGLDLVINGSANQSVDLHDLTLQSLVVSSTGGAVTMADGWTAGTFNQTSGTIDWNGETFDTTGNCTIRETSGGADAMNDVTLTVGGNFRAFGSDLRAESGHTSTITVTGTAMASSVTVAYSDASGGTGVTAYNSTNGGNNTSWTFLDVIGSAGFALSSGLKIGF